MFDQGKNRKVIITCAPTGSIHTPSMSPHLPVTPDEIAAAAIGAAEAGAAILHLHARNPADGSPSPLADDFMAFLPRIKQATDAVINISTGGSATMTLEARLEGAKAAQPELASLNMGPLIFDFSGAAARVTEWLHPWEKPYVEGARDRIMYNDNGFIERIMTEVGQAFGTRFEFECYDVGHLYTLAHFADKKLIQPPFLIQGIFGILGGIGPDVRNMAHMVSVADGLFGRGLSFLGLRGGPQPDDVLHAERPARRPCARRSRGQPLYRQGGARRLQCRAGRQDPAHRRGNWGWRSQHRRKRGLCLGSRAAIRSGSRRVGYDDDDWFWVVFRHYFHKLRPSRACRRMFLLLDGREESRTPFDKLRTNGVG